MGSGLFDASSTSNPTDSRQAATDNARAIRGTGNKYIEGGGVDFSHAKLSSGNLTLTGVKGDVILGDNGQGIAAVSSIFANLIDELLHSGPTVVGAPVGGDVSGGLSGSHAPDSAAADNAKITDAAWWTTPRKIMAGALAALLVLLVFLRK